jgi:hypothetical protein
MRPNQAQAIEDCHGCAAFVTDHDRGAVWALCVPQAAADDPDIGYHHRGNGEYDQIFHLFTSLSDW